MITFSGLNIGVIFHIRELIKENFNVESQWRKLYGKPSFSLVMCPYAYAYNMWMNNSSGEDFYEYESTNNVISTWLRYYRENKSDIVKIEALYTMDGQMKFIMDIANKHSLRLGSYENRILWYGRKIKVMVDDLDTDQNKYITSLLDKKVVSRYKYCLR